MGAGSERLNAPLAQLALFAVAAIYAGNYLIAKGLMPDKIGPSGFILVRVVGAGLLFWGLRLAIAGWRRWRTGAPAWERITRGDWGRLMICGLTGVAINQLLFFNGLSSTSPVHASLIMTVNPVFVLLASAAILKVPVTGCQGVGVVLGGAGAVGLLSQGWKADAGHATWQGDAMVLVNALSYGVYLVAVKPLMARYRPLTVIAWVFLAGALVVVPVGWGQLREVEWAGWTGREWGALGYVVLGTTFGAYLLNVFAMRHVTPTVVSAYIYLQPLLAVALAGWWADRGGTDYLGGLGWGTGVAAVLIFSGVAMVSLPVRGSWRGG